MPGISSMSLKFFMKEVPDLLRRTVPSRSTSNAGVNFIPTARLVCFSFAFSICLLLRLVNTLYKVVQLLHDFQSAAADVYNSSGCFQSRRSQAHNPKLLYGYCRSPHVYL